MNRTAKLLLSLAVTAGSLASFAPAAHADAAKFGMKRGTKLTKNASLIASHVTPDRGGACSGVLTYNGGPVISKIQAVAVYWNTSSSKVDTAITGFAPTYLPALVNSAYVDQLSEYNTTGSPAQKIVRGSYVGAYPITVASSGGGGFGGGSGSVDDSQIGPELASQIKAGKLPAPTYDASGAPNTLYVIFFAPGITITQSSSGSAASSCQQFCGYHGAYHKSGGSGGFSGDLIPYAVIPDMSSGSGCDMGCGPTSDEISNVSVTVSHEVAEAITDVDTDASDQSGSTGIAWYDSTEAQQCQGEIGDLCADGGPDATKSDMSGTVNGVKVQYLWSNKNGKCQLDDPSVPPMTGGGCATNADCSGATPACNTATGACVACTSSAQCSGSTPVCGSDNACHGCSSDSDCSGSTPHCDASGACTAAPATGGTDAGTGGSDAGSGSTGTGGGSTDAGSSGDDSGASTGSGGDDSGTGGGTSGGGTDTSGGSTGDDAGSSSGSGATTGGGARHGGGGTLPTAGGCSTSGNGNGTTAAFGFALGLVAVASRLRRRK